MLKYFFLLSIAWLAQTSPIYMIGWLAAMNVTISKDLRSISILSLQLLAITIGISIHWISLQSIFDQAGLVIVLISFLTAVFPFGGLVVSNLLIRGTQSNYSRIIIPSLCFVMAGQLQSMVGTGRAIWINTGGYMSWLGRMGGVGLVDFSIGLIAFSLSAVYEEQSNVRDSFIGREEGYDRPKNSKLPWTILVGLILIQYLSPTSPTSVRHTHPSPTSPDYIYPPLKISCVFPRVSKPNSKKGNQSSLEEWLAETAIVAARGARVLSWSESAVVLDKDSEGGMGKNELDLLKRVQIISQQYGVSIQATYTLPIKGSHDNYNVATLIAPVQGDEELNVVYTTSKQLPIPFIESYSTRYRNEFNPKGSIPLGEIELKHTKSTPSPHLTPLQRLGISSAICFDISLPSIFRSFIPDPNLKNPLRRPSLILNPSSSPNLKLSLSQLEQVKSTAIQTSSFILRCDSSFGGISTLVSPDGLTLLTDYNSIDSFEFEIDLENSTERRNLWEVPREWTVIFILILTSLVGYGIDRVGNGDLISVKEGYGLVIEVAKRLRERIGLGKADNGDRREDTLISFE